MSSAAVSITAPTEWTAVSEPVEGQRCIGTHSGSFHCDEALACSMLKSLPEWKDAVIVRTRNPAYLDKCDIVVDVGGVYDPATQRFDHHQGTFVDTFSELGFNTRLSSAGLVYRHFGKQFVKAVVAGRAPDDVVDSIMYEKVYRNFMEHIDGIDNGVNAFEGAPRYVVPTTLSGRVAHLNPSWNEDSSDAVVNAQFTLAMALTLAEITQYIVQLVTSWWPARSIVESSLSKALSAHPSGQIVVLDSYCPWKEHLLDLEESHGVSGRTKFVLYAEGASSSSGWRIQTVPAGLAGFESRLGIEPSWWGVRHDKLSEVTGIPGCVFVHANGFIGGNKSKEGALQMAVKSLELQGVVAVES